MDNLNCNRQLLTFLKNSSKEDLILCLHVRNIFELENRVRANITDRNFDLIQMDIEILKSINRLEEIKPNIEKYFERAYDDEIYYLIERVNNLKKNMPTLGSDILESIKDKRFLYFLINMFQSEIAKFDFYTYGKYSLEDINNEYIRLLYLILITTFYPEHSIRIEHIKEDYSQLITKHSLHFEKYDDYEFYRWAKEYMDNDKENQRVSRSTEYSPIKKEDFKPIIHAIFDKLYIEHFYAYQTLKDKLLNAWYQKAYRQKNKGKKGYFFLTDDAHNYLEILSKKYNTSKEKMIEKLINEKYVKECKDNNGKDKYS